MRRCGAAHKSPEHPLFRASEYLDLLGRRPEPNIQLFLSSQVGVVGVRDILNPRWIHDFWSSPFSRCKDERGGVEVSRKGKLLAASLAGTVLLLLMGITVLVPPRLRQHRDRPEPWNQDRVEATYVGSQIKEIDKTHSSLVLSYDLKNSSDLDYRLTDRSSVLILSRLKSDGSFSQEQPFRLSYPVFVPARERAHLAIEIEQPFAWPAEGDPAVASKLRDFVRRRLGDIEEFVVFDEASHRQLTLPSGWQQLQDEAQASY